MDFIGDILEPHSDLLGKIAGTITTFQSVSGFFLLNDIRKKGSSEAFPTGPFLGGIVLTILSLKYGALLGDDAMIKVNIFGFAINVVFMCGFYFYTPNHKKNEIWRQIGLAGIFTAVCLAYGEYEDEKLIAFRFGMLITIFLVVLFGLLPLIGLKHVIKNKCTEGMPFPIIFCGTLVSFSWLLYGFAIRNSVLVFQNLLLGGLGALQLSVFLIYPNTPAAAPKPKKN